MAVDQLIEVESGRRPVGERPQRGFSPALGWNPLVGTDRYLQVEPRSHCEVDKHGYWDTDGHDSENPNQPLSRRRQRLRNRNEYPRDSHNEKLWSRPFVRVGNHDREIRPYGHLQQC